MKLTYAVIRFVPDSARAEFINVGLLVGDEHSGSCQVTIDNTRRLAYAIADRATVDSVWSYLGEFKVGLERHRAQWRKFSFSSEWLLGRSLEAGNLLQFSPPAPVAASDLGAASAILAPLFLHAFATAPGASTPGRNTLIAHVRRAYATHGLELGTHLFERALVQGEHHREVFDFAVANGRAVQLAQTWNFRQQHLEPVSEAVKAWAWTVREIRTNGGMGETDKKTFLVPPDVPVAAVYIEPSSNDGRRALDEALYAFNDVGAEPVTQDDSARLVQQALRLLRP